MRREVVEETGLVVTSCHLLVGFDEPVTHTHMFADESQRRSEGFLEGHTAMDKPFRIVIEHLFGAPAGARNARHVRGQPQSATNQES